MVADTFLKKRLKLGLGTFRKDPAHYLYRATQSRISGNVANRTTRASLRFPRRKNNGGKTAAHCGTSAHRAGLKGHDQGAAGQVPASKGLPCLAQRRYFGVSSGVVVAFTAVPTPSYYVPCGVQDYGTYWDIPTSASAACQVQRNFHRALKPFPSGHGSRVTPRVYSGPMELHVADHPLVNHKLTVLRDKGTPSPTFRQLVDELVTLLAYEATRNVAVEQVDIETPVAPTKGVKLREPRPMVVPVLRAGLGMLDGMTRLLPTAEVGFLGMKRDEDSLEIETYARRLPDDLSGRQCFIVDPMLATGNTLVAAVNYLLEHGAKDVTVVCILAAPEGLEVLEREIGDRANVNVFVAAVDERLNDKAYIVPGLGDAGDRLYGVVD